MRGLVANPRPDIVQDRNSKLNVSGAVGTEGERALLLLGADTIREIIEGDRDRGASEVVCQFCNEAYDLPIGDLEDLISSLS